MSRRDDDLIEAIASIIHDPATETFAFCGIAPDGKSFTGGGTRIEDTEEAAVDVCARILNSHAPDANCSETEFIKKVVRRYNDLEGRREEL